ncbi:MAG TPA: hypothetical protein G4O12_04855 [Dehalococcoidia bacterium]|nr:hypothetical protein [Dehalococcoidia bacterium]
MNKLQKALSSFLKSADANKLAQLLEKSIKTGKISYEEAERMINGDAEDILILGYSWRLLLPIRAAKSGDWEDRILIPRSGETYQMPNVVKHLVENANETGYWDPEKAIIEVFRNIGEPDSHKMPLLVGRMASEVKGHRINGIQIKKICTDLGLGDRVDPLLSELKACGIMSPKLGSLTDAIREGSPIYELNPSLLVGGK